MLDPLQYYRRTSTVMLGEPPARRIQRDANGMPINENRRRRGRGRGRGGGRGGRGGRGESGRGGRQQSSPTAKPGVGDKVSVVQKMNYGTDERDVGIVARVLTRSAQHHRGFKVMLESGIVGRCTELLERSTVEQQGSGSKSESDLYLESIDLLPPAPGIRLRDSET